MEQAIIDKAVKIATRAAMMGHPLAQVIFIPPRSASDEGSFVTVPYDDTGSASTIPPWEL